MQWQQLDFHISLPRHLPLDVLPFKVEPTSRTYSAMPAFEVIDLVSPAKPQALQDALDRNSPRPNSSRLFDEHNYGSDSDSDSEIECLPDLALSIPSLNKKHIGTGTNIVRSRSAPKTIGHDRLDDYLASSSPPEIVRYTPTSDARPSEIVIELSSEDEVEGNTQIDDSQRTTDNGLREHTIASAVPAVQRTATITLPVPKNNIAQNLEGMSRLSEEIDRLLKSTATIYNRKRKFADVDQARSKYGTSSNAANRAETSRGSKLDVSKSLEKARKQAEKDAERERKRLEKEAKVIEKRKAQSIAAVNVLKKSKKDSTPEMILRICASFSGSALDTHLSSFMEALGCTSSLVPMPITGLISFQRREVAEFDVEKGYWIPLSEGRVVDDENQLIIVLKAQEFLKIIQRNSGLEAHVNAVRKVHSRAKVLYLIEGLVAAIRKSSTTKNRAYQAAVRAAGFIGGDTSAVPPPTKISQEAIVDAEAVEDALLDLQLVHQCFIVHSTSPADTAEQISVLTSDISTIPYRTERSKGAAQFCTEAGQIKTGIDARDTLEKMLQSISRVTPQIAQAIASRYTGIRELSKALQAGPGILENIHKEQNVDGSVSGGVLGAATARNIYKALVPKDPHLEA